MMVTATSCLRFTGHQIQACCVPQAGWERMEIRPEVWASLASVGLGGRV